MPETRLRPLAGAAASQVAAAEATALASSSDPATAEGGAVESGGGGGEEEDDDDEEEEEEELRPPVPARSAAYFFGLEYRPQACREALGIELAGLPRPGWHREIRMRKVPPGAPPKVDVFYYAPDGAQIRSRNELERYLGARPAMARHGAGPGEAPLDEGDFDFTRDPALVALVKASGGSGYDNRRVTERVGEAFEALGDAARAPHEAAAAADSARCCRGNMRGGRTWRARGGRGGGGRRRSLGLRGVRVPFHHFTRVGGGLVAGTSRSWRPTRPSRRSAGAASRRAQEPGPRPRGGVGSGSTTRRPPPCGSLT